MINLRKKQIEQLQVAMKKHIDEKVKKSIF